MEVLSGWAMLEFGEKDGTERCVTMKQRSFFRSIHAGDPEIPPATPPEVPPEQPPEVPAEPAPESEPAPPLEVPPGAPPEVPTGVPPETRARAVSQGAIR